MSRTSGLRGWAEKARYYAYRLLGRPLPITPGSEIIDREYIEEESPEEIGEISEMRDIPDKALRHPGRRNERRSA